MQSCFLIHAYEVENMRRDRAPTRARTPTPRAVTPTTGRESKSVQQMLVDLFQLTTCVADAVRATPSSTTAPLARGDVERIVRRTQQHFEARITALQNENAALRLELEDRRGSAQSIEGLRQQLQFEKRQRLQCEEQCQRMADEHAKLVQTLELRIRKQERQIETGSIRGTPRSSRSLALRHEDELELPNDLATEKTATVVSAPTVPRIDIAMSTDAVNDFLHSIGMELDAINAMESERSKHLRTLL